MIRGTTPKIRFTFETVTVSNIAVIYLTIKQGHITVIEKDLSEATVGEDYIEWSLSQEDTLKLAIPSNVNVQIRYRTTDNNAYASRIYTVSAYAILKDGEI